MPPGLFVIAVIVGYCLLFYLMPEPGTRRHRRILPKLPPAPRR